MNKIDEEETKDEHLPPILPLEMTISIISMTTIMKLMMR